MLREYINGKIRGIEELTADLESDIKSSKDRKNELEKLIEILEDENNDGSEIFSPRNHREQNLDKLKQYQEELEKISKEIESKLDKLSETRKKRFEYKSMLAETEKIHQEETYEDINNYQIKSSQSESTRADEKAEQQEREQTGQDENRIEQKENRQEENRESENRPEKEEGEQLNAEIEEQALKNEIQDKDSGEQADEVENEELTVPNAMDTKIIIQKSIEGIVKRIEEEKSKNSEWQEQPEQKYEEKLPQKYEIERPDKNNTFRTARDNLSEIEIKSAELIVLESERKKEREFLEKVKKSIDLCFIYAGNRAKCRNELIKVKRLIENYVSSIE